MLVIFYSFTSKLKTIFAGDLVHMWTHLDAILRLVSMIRSVSVILKEDAWGDSGL